MRQVVRVAALVWLAVAVAVSARMLYVAPDGTDEPPYADWSRASTNVSEAVALAEDGDVVLVTNGVYALSEQVRLERAVTLRSVNGRGRTVLDGLQANRCIYLSHPAALVTGFTLRNGWSTYGAGIRIGIGGSVRDCIISNNVTTRFGGAGVYLNSGGLVEDCLISGNTATNGGDGGGVFCLTGGTVRRCGIHGNRARAGGGAACLYYAVFEDCTVQSNAASFGGGVLCSQSALLDTCTIASNRADVGGGVFAFYGGTLRATTVVGNRAGTGPDTWEVGTADNGLSVETTAAGRKAAASRTVAEPVTLYVSVSGADTNAGTSVDAPLRSVRKAAALALPGDTIFVKDGIYREAVAFARSGAHDRPITLKAYSNETVSVRGSETVTNWRNIGEGVWVLTNWVVNSQQVFVDGERQRQLGWPNVFVEAHASVYQQADALLGRGDLTPGTFYYDRFGAALYLAMAQGDAPSNHVVEVSIRPYLLHMRAPDGSRNAYYRIAGLDFRHCSTFAYAPYGWPGVWVANTSTVADCTSTLCDGAGIALGVGATATGCHVNLCGMMGVGGSRGFTFSHGSIVSNNTRGFNAEWTASGMKCFGDAYGTVEHSEVAWNRGPGIWFDKCRADAPIVVRGNHLHHNERSAVFIEISRNARVYNNLISENVNRAVYISSSEDSVFYNNTIAGHQNWMAVEFFYSPARTNEEGEVYRLRGNRFANNIISRTQGLRDLVAWADDGSNCTANTIDYNCYDANPAGLVLRDHSGGATVFTNLAAWRAASRHDGHSIAGDPAFADPEAGDYHLRSRAGTRRNGVWTNYPVDSPCIDTGDPAGAFDREPQWNGNRLNMGRYGNTPEAAKSTDSDGDGLSDTHEFYGFRSDPDLSDTDGDGADDGNEYVAGTSRTNETSVLRLSVMRPAEVHDVGFSWFGQAERTYRVETQSTLTATRWLPFIGTGAVQQVWKGSNAWLHVTDTARTPACFFRIAVDRDSTRSGAEQLSR